MDRFDPHTLDADIQAAFEPYVKERLAPEDPRRTTLFAAAGKKQRRRWIKNRLLRPFHIRTRRTQEFVRGEYDRTWTAATAVEMLAPREEMDTCEWRDETYLASSIGIKAVHNTVLRRMIEALQPESVLDVGSGNGLNLFTLSMAFPGIRFSGVELTEAGVRAAQSIQEHPEVPEAIRAFSTAEPKAVDTHRRIEFHVGSAAEMPFPDGSFDVLYTSLALEQMEAVRDEALTEVARVARKHVVMVEPFADWNRTGMKLDYVRSREIFQASIADLPRYGLKPVFVYDDMPCKITLGSGLVVAEVV